MSVYLSPMSTMLQLLSDSGVVTQGYLLWTYAAGTSTPVATYTDSTGVTPNGNPIQLNSAGRLTSEIWQTSGQAVKYIFSTNIGTPAVPVFGLQIGQVYDNIQGINDVAYNTTSGTFTGSLTGMTGTVTGPVNWVLIGDCAILTAAFTGVSDSPAMNMTGLPVNLRPALGGKFCTCMLIDNGIQVGGWADVTASTQINFGIGFNNNQSGFTPTGTKGLAAGWQVVYSLI